MQPVPVPEPVPTPSLQGPDIVRCLLDRPSPAADIQCLLDHPLPTADSVTELPEDSAGQYGDSWRGSAMKLNIFWTIKGARWRSNCREIEVPINPALLYDDDNDDNDDDDNNEPNSYNQPGNTDPTMAMKIETLCEKSLHETTMPPARDSAPSDIFPFMSLPLELRLKVYSYLLPSRTHTIVSQYPHNGCYFSAASNVNTFTQSLYPAQHTSSTALHLSNVRRSESLTTYKVVNAGFRHDFPSPSIHPAILRTCSHVKAEAEPVLYGAETIFDFGIFADAIIPFFRDRGEGRSFVTHVRVAREIPVKMGGEDALWSRTCNFFRKELCALRTVDLTVWSADEKELMPLEARRPSSGRSEADIKAEALKLAQWREWDYVEALVQARGLRQVRITYWDFPVNKNAHGVTEMREAFGGWLARRMVADPLVKERMVSDGCVFEGVVVLPMERWRSS